MNTEQTNETHWTEAIKGDDHRLDVFRQWRDVSDAIERHQKDDTAREEQLREMVATREELKWQTIGYLDPTMIPAQSESRPEPSIANGYR